MVDNLVREVVIPRSFNGPPDSGNGGYVCGKVAEAFGDVGASRWIEVTLRAGVPLDKPLTLTGTDGTAQLLDGESCLATAQPTQIALEVPDLPAPEVVEAASKRYRWLSNHPLPECFVCGTARQGADGLRLFAGPVGAGGQHVVASPWRPHLSFADADGFVRPEIVWAALDCPGAFSIDELETTSLKLLGRLTARRFRPLKSDTDCTVIGWYIGSDGRKHEAGTAVFDEGGNLAAAGRALWIELKDGPALNYDN